MKNILIVLGALLVLFLIIGLSLTGSYNSLVTLNEGVESAWAQVETVLQRRYDLIPNLVNMVKGFAAQEREVFTEVTRLRSHWGAARITAGKAQVAGQMEGALSCLLLVAERYPDLKSNQNFLALQEE